MGNAKKILFLAALVSFAAAFAVFETGFKRWTPIAHMPDGRLIRYKPADVAACAKYRARAYFFDQYAARIWME